MELDNILQLTFGLIALLTTIAVSYVTWRFAAGMLSRNTDEYGEPSGNSHLRPPGRRHRRRHRRRRSQLISPPIFAYNNPPSRIPSDQWYRRRAIFMEDTIWSGGLGNEVHVP
jgi:hypothetical protein